MKKEYWTMEKQVIRFSGMDAINYDAFLGSLLFEPSALEFLNWVGSPDISSVLEISCGTGRLTRHLRKYFPAATRLVASDISPDMMDIAKKRLPDAEIEFRIADAQRLPFDEKSFDLVVCQYGLMFLPDKPKGFREVYRVLKPGGHFVFATWDSQENIPVIDLVFNKILLPFLKDENPSRFRVAYSLHDPAQLEDYLTVAGFLRSQIHPVTFKSGITSPEEAVNSFFLKRSIVKEVKEKDPAAVKIIAEEIRNRIKEEFGNVDLRFDLKAFIGIGEK